MKLNFGMMVDGNARQTFFEALDQLGYSLEEYASDSQKRDEIVQKYNEKLWGTYVKNAFWYASFGVELFKRVEDSDYVLFVYNKDNRCRKHFQSIEKTIETYGNEIYEKLSQHSNCYAIGEEKERWINNSALLKPLEREPSQNENRSVFLYGFQSDKWNDSAQKFLRPMDFFLRTTQIRLSGMWLDSMKDATFICLDRTAHLFDPKKVISKVLKWCENDLHHDENNLYDPEIYKAWHNHHKEKKKIFMFFNSLPPRIELFDD